MALQMETIQETSQLHMMTPQKLSSLKKRWFHTYDVPELKDQY